MRRTILAAAFIAISACGGQNDASPAEAAAAPCAAGTATAEGAWLREQADQNAMSAGYFVLCNGTPDAIRLTGVSTPVAGMSELHETTRDSNGVVSMAPIGELTLQPGESVSFEPGGKHVMLMNLSQPIVNGEHAQFTLHFSNGSSITVDAIAKSNAEAAGHAGH